ncbi:C40 family peptidase [Neobacillus sp. Marseille-QA0830]
MGFWNRLANGGLGNSGGLKGLFEEVSEITEKKVSSAKKFHKENGILLTTVPVNVAMKAHDAIKSKNSKYDSKPAFGSVVYCQLGPVEHSGIYVGNNEIVQLNGKGKIEKVGLKGFTGHITTVDSAIYFPCHDEFGYALGISSAGSRALDMVGNRRDYHLLMDNCHQFSSGCITGDFENADNFLWTLKDTFERKFDCTVFWKRWDW